MSDDPNTPPKSEEVIKAERISLIYEDTLKQLRTEERFVNFLKNYDETSRENFIQYYAGRKASWYKYADDRYRYKKSAENRYYVKALEKFNDIFLKKLFNVKCHWVAGEMDLPGVEMSGDFNRFAAHPETCTFVEPISSREFACYMQFMQSTDWVPEFAPDETGEMEEDDDYYTPELTIDFYHHSRSLFSKRRKKEIPLWFRFYDKCFGTASLLDLRLIRSDLEQDYFDIWSNEIHLLTLTPEQAKYHTPMDRAMRKLHKESPEAREKFHEQQNRKWEEQQKSQPQYISLSTYDDKLMEELMPQIETREIIKYFRAEREWRRRDDKVDWIDYELICLQEAKELIPIISNSNYTVAIHEAYKAYEYQEILECLPMVYENYLESQKTGQPFNWSIGLRSRYFPGDSRDRILAARKWKGEPENFDFLKKENLPINY